jgi:hypothetical protein
MATSLDVATKAYRFIVAAHNHAVVLESMTNGFPVVETTSSKQDRICLV